MDESKKTSALLIAASLIGAVRLRGEKVERSPKVMYAMSECMQLARMILNEVERQR